MSPRIEKRVSAANALHPSRLRPGVTEKENRFAYFLFRDACLFVSQASPQGAERLKAAAFHGLAESF